MSGIICMREGPHTNQHREDMAYMLTEWQRSLVLKLVLDMGLSSHLDQCSLCHSGQSVGDGSEYKMWGLHGVWERDCA